MSTINDFVKSKQYKYHTINSEDFYDFISEHDILIKHSFQPDYRDYVFATKDDQVVGYICLMNEYEYPYHSIQDTMLLSNIYVDSDHRNQGISSSMIMVALNHVSNKQKMLKRTAPSSDGKQYTYNKITDLSDSLNIKLIPHNLSFVLDKLNTFKNYRDKNLDDKIKIFDLISNNYTKNNSFNCNIDRELNKFLKDKSFKIKLG
jgi:GNAT superfamily N-acetyltransferase